MDDHRKDIDWTRLERLVARAGTAQELEELERWANSDPELRQIVDAMRTIGIPPDHKDRSWDERQAWARVREQMHATPVRPIRVVRPTPPSMQRFARVPGWRSVFASNRSLIGVAATALVFVVTGSLIVTAVQRDDTRRATSASASAAPSREIVTRRGERATIDLADGTHVILAPGSRLSIPAEFNAPRSRIRELRLEGRAHFTVEHDSTRSFRVVTATAVTEDIGTAFIVSAFPEDRGTRVVVTEGSVALLAPAKDTGASAPSVAGQRAPMILVEGDLGRLDSAGVATRQKVNVAAYLAWTRGTLVFDGARLSAAIPELERWFDVNISLADPALADRRLTGSFAHGSSERLLQALSIALDVDVKQSGQSVVLSVRNQ